MKANWRHLVATATLPPLLLLAQPLAAQSPSADETPPQRVVDEIAAAIDGQARGLATPGETRRRRIVEEALGGGREIVAWTLRQAALRSLEAQQRLTLGRLSVDQARETLAEAEAVFAPTFSVAVSYDLLTNHHRSRDGFVNRKNFQPTDQAIPTNPGRTDPQVTAIAFRPQDEEFDSPEIVEASLDDTTGPTQSRFYTVGVDQVLPWGGVFGVSNVTTDRDVFYKTGHKYDAPFSSTLSFNFISSLPYLKGFGADGPDNSGIRAAKLSAGRQFASFRSLLDQVLLGVEGSYWDLVQALEDLHLADRNRRLVARQTERSRRLFQRGYVTNLGLAQMAAELASARVRVQTARQRYLDASYGLQAQVENSAVGRPGDRLIVPYGYSALLRQVLEPDLEAALALLASRPAAMQVARFDVGLARNSVAFAENQLRPDAIFSYSRSNAQDGSEYGYRRYKDSVGMAMHPDTVSESYTLSYSRPLANRAALASARGARLGFNSSLLSQRQTLFGLRRQVLDGATTIISGRKRIQALSASLEAMRQAFDFLASRRERGLVSEDEIILTTRRLLDTEAGLLAGRIATKKAEASYLAAQGVLARDFALRTAATAFERLRLATLGRHGQLAYFSGREDER